MSGYRPGQNRPPDFGRILGGLGAESAGGLGQDSGRIRADLSGFPTESGGRLGQVSGESGQN